MKKNGFIATSVLYSFFLAFVGLFIGLVTIYIQNKIYLSKFEDSSKNNIYIRIIGDETPSSISINENTKNNISIDEGIIYYDTKSCNLYRCKKVYRESGSFIAEGCPESCD